MSQIDRLSLLRYSERLLIVVGGGPFFAYLGYRLFLKGLTTGEGRFNGEVAWVKFTLSGAGPGLFFMAFGAVLLTVGLLTGRIRYRLDETKAARHSEAHFLSLLRRHPRILIEGLKAEHTLVGNCDSAFRKDEPQNAMLARSFREAYEELEEIERIAAISTSDGYTQLLQVKQALQAEASGTSARRQLAEDTVRERRKEEVVDLSSSPP